MHLILKPVLKRLPPISTPNWDLLDPTLHVSTANEWVYVENLCNAKQQIKMQTAMLEHTHAMMILQDMYLCQLNHALKAKENKQKKGTD